MKSNSRLISLFSALAIWSAGNAFVMAQPVSEPSVPGASKSDTFGQKRTFETIRTPAAEIIKDIPYAEPQKSTSQTLDLYLPVSRTSERFPLVIWIHGGAWKAGDKSHGPFMGLLHTGKFAVASINYRLTGESGYPAQYDDCVQAVRFLVKNKDKFHIDVSRIGLWGASAGGHLVSLVGLRAGYTSDAKDIPVKAVCDWFGPIDLPLMWRENQLRHDEIFQALFGQATDKLSLAQEASPVKYVRKDSPVFLIMHGSKDPTVPIAQSQLFYEKLKQAGAPATLDVIDGAGHGGPGFGPDAIQKVVQFFQTNLG